MGRKGTEYVLCGAAETKAKKKSTRMKIAEVSFMLVPVWLKGFNSGWRPVEEVKSFA
jgi:hypothetical protein